MIINPYDEEKYFSDVNYLTYLYCWRVTDFILYIHTIKKVIKIVKLQRSDMLDDKV